MSIRRTLYMLSGTLRGVFFILIIFVIVWTSLYTQQIVGQLRQEAKEIVEFYATTIKRIASDQLEPAALGWLFENITQKTNFPLILTDANKNPTTWKGIKIPESDMSEQALKNVRNIMGKMARENEPVPITYNGTILNYLYYGDSRLITQLIYLPYISFGALGLLILAAFLGFSSIKKSEQRFIWVGMAKETAHQLGTPISSLMGWQEILKADHKNSDNVQFVSQEMESDIRRLEKIAARFSQIGSQTLLKKQDMHPILADVVKYFIRRLPQTGKEIKIVENYGEIPQVALNRDLFEWTIENLIKNAIDAVKGKKGTIKIITGKVPENGKIFIDVCDNGVGISSKGRRDVFKAGYSTKKRGWGLGLVLAKRIVEEYHRGKLFIKESHVGKGTTMRIVLNK
ncbi:HAMP domain-containing histidine kinase [candidate division KSB1 bacterium]|nr:HAMP domain-containing histidine kinase [candidate division KSB1 bacterium]